MFITFVEIDHVTVMLSFERVKINRVSPDKRKTSFMIEPLEEYSDSEAVAEASRCLGCNICTQACPAGLDIGGYVKSVSLGAPDETVKIVFENLPFPAIIGRVCTHLCEDICVLRDSGGPIAIRHLKRYAADKFDDYSNVLELPRRNFIGKRVAIIGGGPAGLTAAYYLSIQGISITLFEALPVLGGFMRVGIPRYRLPKKILDKEIGFVTSNNVQINLNTKVGKDISFDKIMKEYDAVFIGVGNHKPRMTGTPGSDAKGVWHAITFLKAVELGETIDVGERVVVIGGGFTANDAARVSLRLGAKEVYILYRRREVDRPGYPTLNADEELEEAEEEGVKFIWRVTPFEYLSENGRVIGIKYWQNEMIEEKGSRAKPVPIKDKVYTLKCDTIIEATGQETDWSFMGPDYLKKLRLTPHGAPIIDEKGMTSITGLFSGGDSTNSNRDLISAVRDADRAVTGILEYLNVMDRIADERWLPILDRWKKYSPTAGRVRT